MEIVNNTEDRNVELITAIFGNFITMVILICYNHFKELYYFLYVISILFLKSRETFKTDVFLKIN